MIIRAVAYSRVSSDHEDQINSLKNQKQTWEEYIKANPEWEYIGMYWDEGITGTSTRKRDGFNKMIADAKLGKFDLIITKQVSRWARNTVDSIQNARELKRMGVAVYFISDNIHTIRDPDAELRLSIMSTLAQDESRRISENVKFGHTRAMKNGIVYGNNRVLGYDIIDKKLIINLTEAEIIKKIFYWFIYENESLHGVVKKLNEEGIKKGKSGGKIDHTSIKRIIENEKYCGDLKQRKYYTEDFLVQKQKQNKGQMNFVTIQNHHDPIISREDWDKAQELLIERREKSNRGIGYQRHCWGGKIICGICNDKFRRKMMKNKDGSDRPIWICNTAHNEGGKGCENGGYLREDIIEDAFKFVLKQINTKEIQEDLLNNLQKILTKLLEQNPNQDEEKKIKLQITKIQSKKEKLLELYMDDESNLTKYDFNTKNQKLNEEEEKLNGKLNKITEQINHLEKKKNQVVNFYTILKEKISNPEIIDEIVNEHVREIIKYKDKIVFIFNIGETYEVPLSKYPKRVNSRNYITIMDTKILYLVNRGCVRYYESLNIEVKLVA